MAATAAIRAAVAAKGLFRESPRARCTNDAPTPMRSTIQEQKISVLRTGIPDTRTQ
jgi:hypothetical protein